MATSIGGAIVNGISSGINAVFEGLKSSFLSKVQGLIDGAKSLLGISSPSKVFAYQGKMIGEGLAAGMDDMERRVVRAGESLAAATMGTFDNVNVSGVVAGGNQNGDGQIIQIITLEPSRWQEFLSDAQAGGNFARNFSGELGLRTGAP
jgi:hypothetical protein